MDPGPYCLATISQRGRGESHLSSFQRPHSASRGCHVAETHTNNYSSEHAMDVIELINQNNDANPFKPIGTLDVDTVRRPWMF